MPTGRIYTVDSGQVQVAAATQTPILMVATPSTANVYVMALRIGIMSQAGASYSANGSVQPYFARTSNTPNATGATTTTPTPHRAGGQAANSTWTVSGWTTAPQCPSPTAGGVLWGEPFPLSAGAGWGEWVTPQAEWEIGANSYGAVFVTCSVATTGIAFACEVVFAE
jgi:hypothetical protein